MGSSYKLVPLPTYIVFLLIADMIWKLNISTSTLNSIHSLAHIRKRIYRVDMDIPGIYDRIERSSLLCRLGTYLLLVRGSFVRNNFSLYRKNQKPCWTADWDQRVF